MIRGWREDGPMHLDAKSKFLQIWDSLKVQAGVKYDTGEVRNRINQRLLLSKMVLAINLYI